MDINLWRIMVMLLAFMGCHSENLRPDRYETLISGVHNRFETTGIIFSSSTDNLLSFDVQNIVHSVFHNLSYHQISNAVVTFTQLEEKIIFYRHYAGRPLVVVIIRTWSEIPQFEESIQNIAMSSPIWMMIFTNDGNDRRICEFCHESTKNSFRLQNDTNFFITCCSDTKLEEWWSNDSGAIKVLPVGELVDEKLQWMHNDSTFHRRRDFGQLQLRIAAINNLAVFQNINGTLSGFVGDILEALMHSMNFSISMIFVNTTGSWNESTSKWTGAMNLLHKGEVDLTAFYMTMSEKRLDYADATIPLFSMRNHLFIRKPELGEKVSLKVFFKIFELKVWLAIMAILFSTSAFLTLVEYNNSRENSLWCIISGNFQRVFGIFCQQGLSEFPAMPSLRVTYYSILLTSLIVFAAYSATLASTLAAPSNILPFNSFEEFSMQKQYSLIVRSDTSNYDWISKSKIPMEMRMFKLLEPKESLPTSDSEAISRICDGRVAYYGTLLLFSSLNKMPCKIIYIGDHTKRNFVMMLSRDSPYTKTINHHIIQFHNNGLLGHLKRKYYPRPRMTSKTNFKAVGFSSITPLLAIIGGGIILSSVIFLLEYQYYRKMEERQSRYGRHKNLQETPIFEYRP